MHREVRKVQKRSNNNYCCVIFATVKKLLCIVNLYRVTMTKKQFSKSRYDAVNSSVMYSNVTTNR